jgi:hypothetical protein
LELITAIALTLLPGSGVTLTRGDVQYVVTEIRDVCVSRYLSRLFPDVVVRKDLIDMLEVNRLLLEPISGYLVGCPVNR